MCRHVFVCVCVARPIEGILVADSIAVSNSAKFCQEAVQYLLGSSIGLFLPRTNAFPGNQNRIRTWRMDCLYLHCRVYFFFAISAMADPHPQLLKVSNLMVPKIVQAYGLCWQLICHERRVLHLWRANHWRLPSTPSNVVLSVPVGPPNRSTQ